MQQAPAEQETNKIYTFVELSLLQSAPETMASAERTEGQPETGKLSCDDAAIKIQAWHRKKERAKVRQTVGSTKCDIGANFWAFIGSGIVMS